MATVLVELLETNWKVKLPSVIEPQVEEFIAAIVGKVTVISPVVEVTRDNAPPAQNVEVAIVRVEVTNDTPPPKIVFPRTVVEVEFWKIKLFAEVIKICGPTKIAPPLKSAVPLYSKDPAD